MHCLNADGEGSFERATYVLGMGRVYKAKLKATKAHPPFSTPELPTHDVPSN